MNSQFMHINNEVRADCKREARDGSGIKTRTKELIERGWDEMRSRGGKTVALCFLPYVWQLLSVMEVYFNTWVHIRTHMDLFLFSLSSFSCIKDFLFNLILSFFPPIHSSDIIKHTHLVFNCRRLRVASVRPTSDYWACFRTPKMSSSQCAFNHLTSPSSYIDAWLKSTSLAL